MDRVLLAICCMFLVLGFVLVKSIAKDLQDISKQYDDILDAYTQQYNDFCDEQDKLCKLMNEYHELINAYQIPTIPNVQIIKKSDDW